MDYENRSWFSLEGIPGYIRHIITSDLMRKITETFATRIFLIGLSLVSSIFVARLLGPEGRGLFAAATAISAMGVQFGNLGLHASNTYQVAKERQSLPALISNSLVVSVALGGLIIVIGWNLVLIWPGWTPIHGTLLFLSLVSIPVALAYMLLLNLLMGIQEVRAYNVIELVTKAVGVGLIVVIAIIDVVTTETVFSTIIITSMASLIWAAYRLRKHLLSLAAPSWSLFRSSLEYGLRAYLASIFNHLVYRIDLLMTISLLGAMQGGYYATAATVADMVYLLSSVTSSILFPRMLAIQDEGARWTYTKKFVFPFMGMMLLVIGFTMLFSKFAIQTLYGDAYLPAVPVLRWLMPGIFFWGSSNPFYLYLSTIGIPRQVLYSWAFLTAFNIVVNYLLIQQVGINGVAIIASITYFIGYILFVYYAWRFSRDRNQS